MTTPIVKNFTSERICATEGCTKTGQHMGRKHKDGSIVRRKYCAPCHSKRTAAKHGLANIGQVVAKNAGYRSLTEMKNDKHPYRKYRKDYCENQDGRLGFVCKAVFPDEDVLNSFGIEYGVAPHLDVDHIDGDPSNNKPENLQTLCKCCHSIKGLINGDSKTAGRKTLKAA